MPPKAKLAAAKAKSAPAKAAAPKATPKAVPAKAATPAKAGAPAAAAPKAGAAKASAPTSPAGGGAAAAKALKAEEDEKTRQQEAEAETQRAAEEQEKEEQRKKAEAEEQEKEEARKKAEAEAVAKAEAERQRKKELENGQVVLLYSHYNEKFPIKGGKMTKNEINDVYCLEDVMPKCKIHLSFKSLQEKFAMVAAGEIFPFIDENPPGTFIGLEAGTSYHVHVDEDDQEYLKSLERAKANFADVKAAAVRGEGCSCIEGNPCGAECDAAGNAICKDWANRFAVAKANGWIGYQAK